MTEKELQAAVIRLAGLAGWLAYHTHDSRRSAYGFPDLVLVQPVRSKVMWRELKAEKGRLTAPQEEWLRALRAAGQDADVWRPADWESGRVERELVGTKGRPA